MSFYGTSMIFDGVSCEEMGLVMYDLTSNRQSAIQREWDNLCMLEMTVEHLSGKEAVELVRLRPEGQE